MKYREFIDAFRRELRSHGVTEIHIRKTKNHPRLCFHWRGRDISYVFAGTPSDQRNLQNSLSDLRRVMGVSRVMVKSAKPAQGAPSL